ncbi:SDR family NAD(P)-dependent oxidoreductase [Celeribacter sp.]|uniref:SDR family NAD(P)-dependent oxidoreductase n=1 Tax=Celeribacter sp. TaxID=1890673 RepID=UPI003A9099CA
MGFTLITGATGGLGVAFAHTAARDGHDMILTARDEGALCKLADAIRAAAPTLTVEVLVADLAQEGAADDLWHRATALGEIDVLINNAGLGRHGAFTDTDGAAREATSIAVNITAATQLMRHAAVAMYGRGAGRILNVSSVAAFIPGPNMAVYHATKAYLQTLSDSVRSELAGTGVTVTTLCPGATRTGFFEDADVSETWVMRLFPMGDAASVARAGWRGMMAGRKTVVTGGINKLTVFSQRFLPRAWLAMAMKRIMAKTGR